MKLFPWSGSKPYFSPEENEKIIAAIRNCETRTSGEIRIFIESRNPFMEPLDRATEIFAELQMYRTHHRNAVLLYIAIKDREMALFGDQGIHEQVGTEFWNMEVGHMLQYFKENHITDGILHCVRHVGEVLSEKFPYISSEDKNELPDAIVFGK